MTLNAFDVLIDTDTSRLHKSLDNINDNYYDGRLSVSVAWEVPNPISILDFPSSYKKNSETPLSMYHDAIKAVNVGDLHGAKHIFEQLSSMNYLDSRSLLEKLCQYMSDGRTTKSSNALKHLQLIRLSETTIVPASSYLADRNTIIYHPYLNQKEVPQIVLDYLTFMECFNVVHSNESEYIGLITPPYIMPFQARAERWLKKNGLPVPT